MLATQKPLENLNPHHRPVYLAALNPYDASRYRPLPLGGRLVGWSVGRLVGWSVGRLVGWSKIVHCIFPSRPGSFTLPSQT